MNIISSANWIKPTADYNEVCPVFKKDFTVEKPVASAKLYISALGLYEATLNDNRIGDFILAPGWSAYDKQIQFQEYDITNILKLKNNLNVLVGKGWCVGEIGWAGASKIWNDDVALIAVLAIKYTDGSTENILTDESWQTARSRILMSEIYHGEIYDARITPHDWANSSILNHDKSILIPQEGEIIKEIEEIKPLRLFTAPNGEKIIDFGQNLSGYVQFKVKGKAGDLVEYDHAETLDSDGNFYRINMRGAQLKISFYCSGGNDVYKPHFTFQGFRYIKINSWPNKNIDINDFKVIVIHSDIKRTGHFECSSPLLNQLYSNIIWGQKSNFVDIPTDCPQRDERLGWTGDAQVFVRTASYNYDVNKFFTKWLHDLALHQYDDGGVPDVIPNALGNENKNNAGWADAAVICPWQIYLTYDNKDILIKQFDSMKKWVDFIRKQGDDESVWIKTGGFCDWLNLDDPKDIDEKTYPSYISNAFYSYSTSLLIKAGKVLGKDMSEYENLYKNIISSINSRFIKDGFLLSNTQTAHIFALYFNLVEDKKVIADRLATLIKNNGTRLKTGFLGTPYLLHVLSDNGYTELAYSLILQEAFPSWLFSVKMGATTMWEHWDSIKPDGTMWDPAMNSFNHYAYGAVADWMYGVMAGINIDENQPGFKHIIFKPLMDNRLDYVKASIDTKYGLVASEWVHSKIKTTYDFTVPDNCTATIYLDGEIYNVKAGKHEYIID